MRLLFGILLGAFLTVGTAFIYDTTLSGHSNAGHSSADFLGKIPWKNSPGALHDLLEYMKTL